MHVFSAITCGTLTCTVGIWLKVKLTNVYTKKLEDISNKQHYCFVLCNVAQLKLVIVISSVMLLPLQTCAETVAFTATICLVTLYTMSVCIYIYAVHAVLGQLLFKYNFILIVTYNIVFTTELFTHIIK